MSEKFNMQHPLFISLESSGFSEKIVTLEQKQYLISSCKELTFYRDEAYEMGHVNVYYVMGFRPS